MSQKCGRTGRIDLAWNFKYAFAASHRKTFVNVVSYHLLACCFLGKTAWAEAAEKEVRADGRIRVRGQSGSRWGVGGGRKREGAGGKIRGSGGDRRREILVMITTLLSEEQFLQGLPAVEKKSADGSPWPPTCNPTSPEGLLFSY